MSNIAKSSLKYSNYIKYTIHFIPRRSGLYKIFLMNFWSQGAEKLPVCSANCFSMVTLGRRVSERTEEGTWWREVGGTTR